MVSRVALDGEGIDPDALALVAAAPAPPDGVPPATSWRGEEALAMLVSDGTDAPGGRGSLRWAPVLVSEEGLTPVLAGRATGVDSSAAATPPVEPGAADVAVFTATPPFGPDVSAL